VERRAFIVTMAGGLLSAPRRAGAQPPARIPRIGYLATRALDSPDARAFVDAFRQGLRERGYPGADRIVIEYRAADGDIGRFPALAAELVRLKVDVIVATNTPAARAARQATSTIPIVVPVMGDPVGDGLVTSLARPGGNVTGLTFLGPELVPKRLELMREAIPKVSRGAALWHPEAFSEHTTAEMQKETQATAQALGIRLQLVGVRRADELAQAFSTMAVGRAEAVLVFPSPLLFAERRRIVDLAAARHLPSMAVAREFVELGGLMAYGASITDLSRRSATFVDRILRGARPGDLPVEQPTKFELVVNLRTAKILGLVIPPALLQRVDQAIE
jgi:putative ABC transport system substrate-binding protein